MRVSSLIVAALSVCLCASTGAAADWQTESILPLATFWAPSVAIGADHIPHMAASSQNGVLLYLSLINGVWQIEMFSQQWDAVQGARGLRMGPDGRARIAGGTNLYVQTPSGWNRSYASIVWWDTGIAMAIDAQGVSRFCNTWYVSYWGMSGLSFDQKDVATAPTFPTNSGCAMEFTRDGTPAIVGLVSSTRPLVFYLQKPDGTWNSEEIGAGLSPAMALDAADRIHICYTTYSTNQLIHAIRVAPGEWVSETVDSSGGEPSIAIASNGRVCIAYHDPNLQALKFASRGRGETTWHVETVDAGNVAGAASLAVDGNSMHIAYLDGGNGLRHASELLVTGVGSSPAFEGASIRAIPNPFNPATMIEYVVPARGRVRVSVYDAAGRMLERLVDDVRDAGSYRVPYRSRAASGVYFARVEVAGSSATTKIVLLK